MQAVPFRAGCCSLLCLTLSQGLTLGLEAHARSAHQLMLSRSGNFSEPGQMLLQAGQ